MALYSNVTVAVSSLGGGLYAVQVGPETYTADGQRLREMVRGIRKEPDYLVHQIALQLDAQGVDPGAKTPAQLKTLIEAMTLKW